jgi:DNA-binding MarR family transcriptional regulator
LSTVTGPHSADTAASGGLDRGKLRGRLGPELRMVRNLLLARVSAAYAPFKLRPGGYTMMALIAANPGCSQSDLSREIAMDKSAVVAILDDLFAKNLVRRTRSPSDRRRHNLELTEEGETLLQAMQPASELIEQPIADALSPKERTQLVSLLERIRLAMEACPLKPGDE